MTKYTEIQKENIRYVSVEIFECLISFIDFFEDEKIMKVIEKNCTELEFKTLTLVLETYREKIEDILNPSNSFGGNDDILRENYTEE